SLFLMAEAWRITREKHAKDAFSGEGAAKMGGRWNSRGVAVVYASSTRALAALETLVHLNPTITFSYKIIRLEFDERLVQRLALPALPEDWKLEPPPRSTQRLG